MTTSQEEKREVIEIIVIVYYQSKAERQRFKGFEQVKDVLAWAIKAFQIDRSLATELALVKHGEKDELPDRETLDKLVEKDMELELDLVRGDITNG